ncbi:tRNA uridine(34) hydroxylase [Buchnera aphidicola (Eriosoma lanigerum)]|uniref:oxygen-dependent tRNA uridine(34) hydroxylase TrhO n=1 Tax=Buchnera aphidicola TaxID=9 RepID=UPI003463F229
MFNLFNTTSNNKLQEKMINDNTSRITLSFYKYFYIRNPLLFRNNLYILFYSLNILGRVYVSKEGVNAQISIPKDISSYFKNILLNFSNEFNNIIINESIDNNNFSFWVLRIKVRNKLVSDGIEDKNFNPYIVGTYLNADLVNVMFNERKSIFVDMRNNYEYAIGHFDTAININRSRFRDQLKIIVKELEPYRNNNIILYCTGGIRCEKSTAWLKYHGFKHIYHIKNGIIGYVNEARKKNLPIYFKGKNFVFDARLTEKISEDILSFCQQCNNPCDTYVNCSYSKCHLLFIQCTKCSHIFNYCCSSICQRKINI